MRKNLLIRMLVGFLLLLSTECAQEYSDDEKEYKYKYEEYKEKECDSDTNDFNEKIVKQKIKACYQILGLE